MAPLLPIGRTSSARRISAPLRCVGRPRDIHVLITLALRLRWPAIRGEFRRRLEQRLRQELESIYAPISDDVAQSLRRSGD